MPKTVYLVDKDPAVIDLISIMHKDKRYRTFFAAKPFRICEVRSVVPELILLHNGLDDMDLEICSKLKEDTETSKITEIMSSTRNNLPELSRMPVRKHIS